tara:strand:- start:1346 stop:2443 length:1098 start_codon:yes stop_codon:yes gene_type:complete
MKNIYIHIGTGKTGTTAIQEFLSENTDFLNKNNIQYCKSGRTSGINHLAACRNHQRNDKNSIHQLGIKENLENIYSEINESNFKNFIISSENFPGLSNHEIDELVSYFKDLCSIKVIVYFRRQDEFFESWYSQVVKTSKSPETPQVLLNKLIKNEILDYQKIISKWDIEEVEMIVKVYEVSEFEENNVIYDFLNIFNLKDFSSIELNKEKKSNLSISREQAFIKKEILKYCHESQTLLFSKPFPIKTDKEKYILSPIKREDLLKNYSNSNKYIALKYFGRNQLFKNTYINYNWKPIILYQSDFLIRLLVLVRSNKNYFLLREPLFKYLMDKSYISENNSQRLYFSFLAHFLNPNNNNLLLSLKKL